jgi:phosphate transport system substrate-binding protein
MINKRSAFVVNLSLVTTFTTITAPWVAAQAYPAFPEVGNVGKDVNVRMQGSKNIEPLNQSLKQGFEKKTGAKASLTNAGTTAALAAVAAGKADIAAIGRPLTDAEKAKGLVSVPIGREKIAIVVSKNNPHKKDLTITQFAKVFRGEVKNWSEIGGAKTPIQFVDRTEVDTRKAFPNYPAFKGKALASGANAVKLADENPATMSAKLGNNGMSFMPASLLGNQKDVRVLTMHGVLPTDIKYPFSQPLYYVYKGDKPNAAVKAFLGYAGSKEGQATVLASGVEQPINFNNKAEAAAAIGEKPADTTAANKPADKTAAQDGKDGTKTATLNAPDGKQAGAAGADGTPKTESNGAVASNQIALDEAQGRGIPPWLWWLLLPLGLLGLLLWLLPKDDEEDDQPLRPRSTGGNAVGGTIDGVRDAATRTVGGVTDATGRAVGGVTDATGKVVGGVADAAGDAANAGGAAIAGAGAAIAGAGAAAMARLRGNRDNTSQDTNNPDSNSNDWEPVKNLPPNDYTIETPDWNLNIPETGEVVADDPNWIESARDAVQGGIGNVRDAAGNVVDGIGDTAGGAGAAAAGAGAAAAGLGAAAWSRLRGEGNDPSNRTPGNAESEWEFEGELPSGNFDASPRMADYAGTEEGLVDRARDAASDTFNRLRTGVGDGVDNVGDGLAKLRSNTTDVAGGATTKTSGWLKTLFGKAKDTAGDVADAAGNVADSGAAKFAAGTAAVAGAGAVIGSAITGAGRINLVPYNSREALVRWDLDDRAQDRFRDQGGNQMVLRLYDVTDLAGNPTDLPTYEQFDVDANAKEQRILIPQRNRKYLTILGYLTRSGGFLEVARSESVQIPAA